MNDEMFSVTKEVFEKIINDVYHIGLQDGTIGIRSAHLDVPYGQGSFDINKTHSILRIILRKS